jgi:Mn-dependent DtxR family transcriptional regulator
MSDRIDSAELPIRQEMLAQTLGVRRTTVTFVAQKFQHEGLIHFRRGRVSILKRNGLQGLACECYNAWRQADMLLS